MVGNREGGQFKLNRSIDKSIEVAGTVQEAVLGMHVKMDKIGVNHIFQTKD